MEREGAVLVSRPACQFWSSQDSVDTPSPSFMGRIELLWAHAAQVTVATNGGMLENRAYAGRTQFASFACSPVRVLTVVRARF